MAAVAQNGQALLWASDELKRDKAVVMTAVAQVMHFDMHQIN